MMDKPRALKMGEWEQLNTLVTKVFRPQMFRQYPQLFNETNRANLRVVTTDGKVISHVGLIERPASLLGCSIQTYCVGAVATLPEYRKRGSATATLENAVARARANGADLMLISGNRDLYHRAGSRAVGNNYEFTITPPNGPRLQATSVGIRMEEVSRDQLSLLAELYALEAIRFIRRREDWDMAHHCGHVMNRATEFHLIYRGRKPAAYLLLQQTVGGGSSDDSWRIAEFAGDRTALVTALGQLTQERNIVIRVHVQRTDIVLQAILNGAAVASKEVPTSGTLMVINFVQLMERMRPLIAERLGTKITTQLSFYNEGEMFVIAKNSEMIMVNGLGDLVRYLFGAPNHEKGIVPQGSAKLTGVLNTALPFPALWYGITYI